MTSQFQALLMRDAGGVAPFVCAGGPVWTSDTLPAGMRGYAVIYAGSRASVLGIISGGAGVGYYTDDHGDTWNASVVPTTGGTLPDRTATYGNGLIICAYDADTYITSSDGGATYSVFVPFIQQRGSLEFCEASGLFIQAPSITGAFCWIGSGIPLTPVAIPNKTWHTVCVDGTNTVLMVASDTTCIRSSDGGASFPSVVGNLPVSGSGYRSGCGNGAGTWVVTSGAANNNVYVSVDNGSTWTTQAVKTVGPGCVWPRVRYKAGRFLLIEDNGDRNFTSDTGLAGSWIQTDGMGSFIGASYSDWDSDNNGHYVAIGDDSTFSTDVERGLC